MTPALTNRMRQHPRTTAFVVGLIVAFVATLLETLRLRYMNYLVYTDSTLDFWHGVNPYSQQFVDDHGRYFLYTPVFSVLYTPFALLPRWLGPFVWNLTNYTLFSLSVFTLPRQYEAHKLHIFLALLLLLEQSVFPFQFNIVVAYCFLFAFTLLENDRPFWAVLLIMVSATTKVYGIVELLLLFCYRHTWRNLAMAALTGALLLMLPALKTGLGGLMPCYQQWWDMLTQHQSSAYYVSLLYAWPLRYVLPYYRIIQLLTVGAVIAVFFLRRRHWSDFSFRAVTLGVLMGWIILFGDSSETHTYLIAMAGYMLWYFLQQEHSRMDRVLFWSLFVFFGIVPVDVFVPTPVHDFLNGKLLIDVYLYAVVWCRMLWSLLVHI